MSRSPRSVAESIEYLNRNGACVEYRPDFLTPAEARHYLGALLEVLERDPPERALLKLPFSRERVPIPRRQSAYGDPGTSYEFSGCVVRARPWIPLLLELRTILQARADFRANFVLLNHYGSGSDRIGWHSDDERDLGDRPTILSLSLGATRDFQLRRKPARTAGLPEFETVTIPLESGSLLTLRHPTNANWKHQVPRRGGSHPERIGERLNLTWRCIVGS